MIGTSVKKQSYLTDASAFTNPNYYSRNVNPYQEVRDADGNFVYDQNIAASVRENGDFVKFNIIEERENTRNTLNSLQLKGVFDLEYEIIDGLTYGTLFGIQLENNDTEKWASQNSYYYRSYKAGTRYYSGGYKYWLPEGVSCKTIMQIFSSICGVTLWHMKKQ